MELTLVILVLVIAFLVSYQVCTHNVELSKLLCPASFASIAAIAAYFA
ncbi:hypothetical protein EYM_02410 [Ignicoccus islandicus DSM 13165]|uniref:Uncharacterized protein n=1 Tax=Ignicoccus islandicus DSM 13165 TaxID=940295 RepID=A0A0U2WMZ0_9CREN|nr:hypothetical protein [Ignicoccus islandicus]ALU12321.1 hypothetical protein EYM_02410 [Ignicoccus islandicus DSM 13165]